MLLRFRVALLAVVALIGGCAAGPADPVDVAAELAEDLSAIPGAMPVEPHLMSMTVDMSPDATDEQVRDAAHRVVRLAGDADYLGTVDLARPGPDAGASDSIRERTWTVRLHPPESAEDPDALTDILAIERLGGVRGITVIDGWPYVTIDSIEQFSDRFHGIRDLALFRDGGTYTLFSDEHLRIVHVPSRTSTEAIDVIIGIARDHPDAEVLLEAMTDGPQWPKLWVARLTPDEVADIDRLLRDPGLADADVEGHPLDYQLTTVGDDGPVYTEGTFGDVPH
ncbi:hypothetical protein CLV46_0415 [Diaminobutyricimonas aerilata]|uniref:Uncharacterized protein n=1 Tax=Diaminobutyricimonas aerilata TaxID=1162967 RepID=A0A2M9CG17_9MICO|nr:hypothetical protein [Diaminobutyricimonas aerilata]PJJ70886.1 hypothetical protein CLV46_0415 [Diaminobutyricimonas aerilata]